MRYINHDWLSLIKCCRMFSGLADNAVWRVRKFLLSHSFL
uniref:Uncharacterized protein n=1 Tax=Anguilla anguilla TaxID=7936 RepID=A0A0E9VB54_ANGAN